MTPQIDHLGKTKQSSEGFNTHLLGFSGDRWENIHFERKPRQVTPQIDRLEKTSTVLRVSTHIYGVSQEIDGTTFIFQTKPRHMTPQINRLGEMSTVLRVSTHIFGVSQVIDGKTCSF